jgi:hypothetical protein
MKKISLKIIICLLLIAIITAGYVANDKSITPVMVTTKYLYVYSCPNITCYKIGMALMYDHLNITGADVGELTPIEYFGQTGYVNAAGLEK